MLDAREEINQKPRVTLITKTKFFLTEKVNELELLHNEQKLIREWTQNARAFSEALTVRQAGHDEDETVRIKRSSSDAGLDEQGTQLVESWKRLKQFEVGNDRESRGTRGDQTESG